MARHRIGLFVFLNENNLISWPGKEHQLPGDEFWKQKVSRQSFLLNNSHALPEHKKQKKDYFSDSSGNE